MSGEKPTPAAPAHLGSIIMNLRQFAGITREVFGEAVGLSEVDIKRFETGRIVFRTAELQRILRHPAMKDAHRLALAAGIEPPSGGADGSGPAGSGGQS